MGDQNDASIIHAQSKVASSDMAASNCLRNRSGYDGRSERGIKEYGVLNDTFAEKNRYSSLI